MEPARITNEQARSAKESDLVAWANRFRPESGAHMVVVAELERRADRRRSARKIAVALIVGAVGLGFYVLRQVL